ncbi:hypothetical protein GQ600_4971 [Phytophthora cactorum]|nr:hypothetical protein GQ600_4971 [Phytophthora cactorum]
MISKVAALSRPVRSRHTGTSSGHRPALHQSSRACVLLHSRLVAVRRPPQCPHTPPCPRSGGKAQFSTPRCRAYPLVGPRAGH